ncbi:37S ribosomal protein S9, mitochondrial [Tieghemiomyces parasiticus]|uniref:Small ribosomal subunit protein uS9m n=1 Tax=Tieghemiomyces parasiticus TaxID=78921 RepID=A0A9W7ZZJ2_9FUNG|nr:37S ribosomal protein S9, mitochondrial [Tieghemiomyces parasiticus]
MLLAAALPALGRARRPGMDLALRLASPAVRTLSTTTPRLSIVDSGLKTRKVQLRERPVSATYFTGNVGYNDLLVGVNALVHRHIHALNHPVLSDTDATTRLMFELDKLKQQGLSVKDAPKEIYKQFTEPFLDRKELGIRYDLKLREGQYHNLLMRLHWLLSLDPKPAEVRTYLRPFMARSMDKTVAAIPEAELDDEGRTYALGRRKEAQARVWLVEGEGHIIINGRSLADYFVGAVPREAVIHPFEKTRSLGQYNVWCKVRGSGTTGQSEAIALAIARALARHTPEFKETLAADNGLKRDPRMVERKKTGQPKARKKYTWVKR